MQDFLLCSKNIKAEALRLGFYACGLSPAAPMDPPHIERREQWLRNGCHADMSYLERNEEKRRDPRLLVQGVRTIISVALNYYNPVLDSQTNKECFIPLAHYARGKDYHDVVKEKLRQLLESISQMAGDYLPEGSRIFTDTAPVDEKYWAWRGGLGWIGKNTQLIIPRAGSYFFLGEIFLTLPVDNYDSPIESRCGSCTKCREACPGGALSEEYGLDARRCLSYLTIEYRGEELPPGTGEKMGDIFYGCDRCLACCPWNRFSRPTAIEAFYPQPDLQNMKTQDWRMLTVEQYTALFKGSAVKRAKYAGLTRNIRAIYSKDEKQETEDGDVAESK